MDCAAIYSLSAPVCHFGSAHIALTFEKVIATRYRMLLKFLLACASTMSGLLACNTGFD